MSTQFDLEQQILECWRVTDDINMLYKSIMDKHMTKDDITNVLLGLKSIYQMKFDNMWQTFEEHLKEFYEAKKNAGV